MHTSFFYTESFAKAGEYQYAQYPTLRLSLSCLDTPQLSSPVCTVTPFGIVREDPLHMDTVPQLSSLYEWPSLTLAGAMAAALCVPGAPSLRRLQLIFGEEADGLFWRNDGNPPPASSEEAAKMVDEWTTPSAGRHLLMRTRRDYEQLVLRYESERGWRRLKWLPRIGKYKGGPRWNLQPPLKKPGFCVPGPEPPWPTGLTYGVVSEPVEAFGDYQRKWFLHHRPIRRDFGETSRRTPLCTNDDLRHVSGGSGSGEFSRKLHPDGYHEGWDRFVLMREDAIMLCSALDAVADSHGLQPPSTRSFEPPSTPSLPPPSTPSLPTPPSSMPSLGHITQTPIRVRLLAFVHDCCVC